jgi:DNA-binding GntR family transcriptional regulator
VVQGGRDKISPTQVQRLAAVSRAYREAKAEISEALLQEALSREPEEVAEQFGLSREEMIRYLPEHVLRLREGFVHRAHLRSTEAVLADVLLHIELGRLKPGDQFPPRTAFTEMYRCDKKTHGEVVDRLVKDGVVQRTKVRGGPLYVL